MRLLMITALLALSACGQAPQETKIAPQPTPAAASDHTDPLAVATLAAISRIWSKDAVRDLAHQAFTAADKSGDHYLSAEEFSDVVSFVEDRAAIVAASADGATTLDKFGPPVSAYDLARGNDGAVSATDLDVYFANRFARADADRDEILDENEFAAFAEMVKNGR